MSQLTASYEEGLKAQLLDPEKAAAHLNASMEEAANEGDQALFLLALRNVVGIQGDLTLPEHLLDKNYEMGIQDFTD